MQYFTHSQAYRSIRCCKNRYRPLTNFHRLTFTKRETLTPTDKNLIKLNNYRNKVNKRSSTSPKLPFTNGFRLQYVRLIDNCVYKKGWISIDSETPEAN